MSTAPSNEGREAFEEEATYFRMNLVCRPSGKYHRIHTQNAWEIWQAAFAHTKRRDGVPEGWQLVPIKITKSMVESVIKRIYSHAYSSEESYAEAIYTAALENAPKLGETK